MAYSLYVWRGTDVLRRYGTGVVCVYAQTLQEARLLGIAAVKIEFDWIDWNDPNDCEDELYRLDFFKNDPEIFNTPIAIVQQGSC